MTTVVYTAAGWVPLAGVPSGPGPDPEDPKVPPPAVIILSATSPSPTELRVTWLAPSDPNAGGVITHYQVDVDGVDYNWSLTALTITIGDLEPDSQHTITVRAVNNYGLVGPDATISAWTQVETPYDADLGTIGNRPTVDVKPTAADTGPRQATTQTMSGSQALTAALNAPVESDGKRYLRRVRITSAMTLSKVTDSGIVFEDCVIDGGSATYGLKAYLFLGIQPASWPEFRYCEISGGTSATVAGGYIRLLRCNISGGTDLLKIFTAMEIYASYAHDTWWAPGSHCDVVQITTGAANTLIHWSNLEGFNDPASGGGQSSGVLQTGTTTGNIGPVEWLNNWLDGGGYTLRGPKAGDDQSTILYTFRNNRHGRGATFGPLYRMGYPGIDYDSSNVWADTGLPVS